MKVSVIQRVALLSDFLSIVFDKVWRQCNNEPMSMDPELEVAPALFGPGETVASNEAKAVEISVLWPKRRPRYLVVIWLRENPNDFECVSLKVSSIRPNMSVDSAIVRELPVGALIREAIQIHLANRLRFVEEALITPPDTMTSAHFGPEGISVETGAPDAEFLLNRSAALEAMVQHAQQRLGKASGIGKGRRYPAGHLEEVATIVRRARREQLSAQAQVMEAFGLMRSTAANQIARAKARGLLDEEEN